MLCARGRACWKQVPLRDGQGPGRRHESRRSAPAAADQRLQMPDASVRDRAQGQQRPDRPAGMREKLLEFAGLFRRGDVTCAASAAESTAGGGPAFAKADFCQLGGQ